MKLSEDLSGRYALMALKDKDAAMVILDECGEYTNALLSVAECILENLSRASFYKDFSKREKELAVGNLLRHRCRFINSCFSWTGEKRKRFLLVNDSLINSCGIAWDEALSTAAVLEERIKQNDTFMKDFEIDVRINAYPSFGNDDDFDEVQALFGDELPSTASISHSNYEMSIKLDRPLDVDRRLECSICNISEEFENVYISSSVNRMLYTKIWSYEDIISISSIWADVKVTHQNYIELETSSTNTP